MSLNWTECLSPVLVVRVADLLLVMEKMKQKKLRQEKIRIPSQIPQANLRNKILTTYF
jgi:hypothetical protein